MIRRLIRDQGGASAVEFALIAPILIAMYFGIAELGQGMMSGNKTGEVASSIGDLASQNTCLTNAQVADIFTIGGLLLKPFPTAGLTIRISSLTSNATTGAVKVDWSDGSGMTALGVGSTQTVPAGLIVKGQTVILAESSYKYNSPIHVFISSSGVNFTKRYYLRPRRSDSITRVATSCT